MHTESIERWVHDHTFGQDRKKSAEHRTLIVIAITLVTMAVEIAAGIAFGSMALLADTAIPTGKVAGRMTGATMPIPRAAMSIRTTISGPLISMCWRTR